MKLFKEIPAQEIVGNPFKMIGTDWMLITAGNKEKLNTMTASWGGAGVLWHKNAVFIFVRPQRYTREFLDANTHFTLTFFENRREALRFCGTHSGRDCDKAAETGLTPVFTEKAPYFEQASLVIVCKKMYRQRLNEESVIDSAVVQEYQNGDYHYMYVGEIEKVLSAEVK